MAAETQAAATVAILVFFTAIAFTNAQPTPPTPCLAVGSAIDGASIASSAYPADGYYHFQVCSGVGTSNAYGNRFQTAASTVPTCKIGDRIPLYFQAWAPYVNLNGMNITFMAPTSPNYAYMSFMNQSNIGAFGTSLTFNGVNLNTNTNYLAQNLLYSYAFNDENATQVQLQMGPVTVGSVSTLPPVQFAFYLYVMVVNSPDIANMSNNLLNVSITVDMIDQAGYQSTWVTQWGCNFTYDLPVVNATTTPTFGINGPSVLMVGDVGVWYLNITSYDLINNIAVDVNGPNNDSTVFNILSVNYNPVQYGNSYAYLPGANPIVNTGITTNLLTGNTNIFGISVTSTAMVSWSTNAINLMYREASGYQGTVQDNTIGIVIVGQLLSGAINNTNYTLTVACELNTVSSNPFSAIYVSQLQFTSLVVSDNSSADLFYTPSFNAYSTLTNGVVGGYYPLFVNLSAIDTLTNYQVEVYTGVSASSTVQSMVVSMQALTVGGNYPAFFPGTPVYNQTMTSCSGTTLCTTTTPQNDYGVWYLGQISNTMLSTTIDANNIVIQINLVMLQQVTSTVAVGVRYNVGQPNEMFWTATLSITTIGNYTPTVPPTFSWNSMGSGSIVSPGSVAQFGLQVTLPATQVIYPLTVQVSLPVYNSSGTMVPLLSICRIMVGTIGNYLLAPKFSSGLAANLTTPNGLSVLNPTFQQPTTYSTNGTAGSAAMNSTSILMPNSSYVTLSIPAMTNVARYSYPWETVNSTFTLLFALAVSSVSANSAFNTTYPFINGTAYWSNILVTYGSTSVWSTISLLTISPTPVGTVPPVIFSVNNVYPSGRSINMGEIVNFDLVMTTPPNTQTAFNISVEGLSVNIFSAAIINFNNRGLNFPCVCDPTSSFGQCCGSTPVTVYNGAFNGNAMYAYTNTLSNIGIDPLNTNDPVNMKANSMIVSCGMMVRGDAVVTPGANYSIAYTIQQLNGSTFAGLINFTIANTIFADSTNISSSVAIQVVNNMTTYPRGAAVDVSINVTTYPSSLGTYTVAFSASYNMSGTVVSYPITPYQMVPIIVMTSVGSSLPTVNGVQLQASLKLNQPQNVTSPFDMQAVGSAMTPWPVSNWGYYERVTLGNTFTTEWLAPRNVMSFEGAICIPASYNTLPSMNTQFTVSVVKNGTQVLSVSTFTQPIAIADTVNLTAVTPAPYPNISITAYNGTTSYFVNTNYSFVLNITLHAQVTMDFTITFISPLVNTSTSNQQAAFSFFGMSVLSQGTNVLCPIVSKVSNTSTFSNRQNDTMVWKFYMTNTMLTNRGNYPFYNYSVDDTVLLLFNMWVTDASINVNGSMQSFTVNVSSSIAATQSVTVGNLPILCAPSSDVCTPILYFNSTANVSANAAQGTTFPISISFWHPTNSHADAFAVTLRHFLPPYVTVNTPTCTKSYVSQWTTAQNVQSIYFDSIRITDQVTCTMTATIDPSRVLPAGMLKVHTVIPIDLSYYQANKSVLPYPNNGTYKYSGFQLLQFDFNVPECSNSLNVMNFTTCQFGASASLPNYNASGAAYNGSTWISPYRGVPFAGNEWLQITLTGNTRVTGVVIQGSSADPTYYTTSFRLQYSQETLYWMDYVQNGTSSPYIFNVSSQPPALGTTIMLPSQLPIIASYIRFIPLSNSKNNYSHPVRIDLLGCVLSVASTQCYSPVPASTPAADYKERSYLTNSDSKYLYVCMTPSLGAVAVCSLTSDTGVTWYAIDDHVANIQFYSSSTKQLYGLGWDLQSRVRSDDNGFNWYAIMQVDYDAALSSCTAATCTYSVALPFIDYSAFNGTYIYTTYGISNSVTKYAVSNNGICTSSGTACSTTIACWGNNAW